MAISILPGDGLHAAAHEPAGPLGRYVSGYWSLVVNRPPVDVRVVPDGLVDVVFELRTRKVFVGGPRQEPTTFTHYQPTELLGASLQPGTTRALLGVSAAALGSGWQPLERVIGAGAAELGALVFAAATLRDRLALLDAFFVARIFATASEPRIQQAIARIVDSDGAIDVSALGRAAGASPRNLGRLFDDWVGMSPKRFARIVRLQSALRRLAEAPDSDLSQLALDAGYADQAHLTREMQALAGVSPGELALSLSDSFKK